MIVGRVEPGLDAILQLTIQGPTGQEVKIEAVVDTGFNGWLTLPPTLIHQLDLSWQQFGQALLADGSHSLFGIYEGIIVWDGQPRTILVDEADTMPPLVGMALLQGFELTIQVRPHGMVTIQPLP